MIVSMLLTNIIIRMKGIDCKIRLIEKHVVYIIICYSKRVIFKDVRFFFLYQCLKLHMLSLYCFHLRHFCG